MGRRRVGGQASAGGSVSEGLPFVSCLCCSPTLYFTTSPRHVAGLHPTNPACPAPSPLLSIHTCDEERLEQLHTRPSSENV